MSSITRTALFLMALLMGSPLALGQRPPQPQDQRTPRQLPSFGDRLRGTVGRPSPYKPLGVGKPSLIPVDTIGVPLPPP